MRDFAHGRPPGPPFPMTPPEPDSPFRSGPPPGPPPWAPPYPPRGAIPRVKKGDVRAAALALLAEGPCNGYQIIQRIAARSHGIWRPSPGSVYPALQQLEDEGLVRSQEENGRRTYHLTGEGRRCLDERGHPEPWEEVADSVSEELVGLHSLLGQVGMAMRQVVAAGTPAQVSAARRILTDTRRSLYRLLAEDPQEDA